jgi:anti-sigma B factor antagonist
MFDQITVGQEDGVTVVKLRGEFIGGDETDALRSKLTELAGNDTQHLVVDLAQTEFLNSTALGVLISAHANFTKRNGKVALTNLAKKIENIFVITKLTLVFDIYSSIGEATKKIKQ